MSDEIVIISLILHCIAIVTIRRCIVEYGLLYCADTLLRTGGNWL